MKITQEDRTLKYMLDNEFITCRKAMLELGIGHLPTRIMHLRNEGYSIESKKVARENRYGRTVYYTEYRLNRESVEMARNRVKVMFADVSSKEKRKGFLSWLLG